MKTLACTLSRQDISTRLHWHAIFGDVSVFDTCRTQILARLVGLRCPSGVVFFFFFSSPTRHQRGADTLAVEKKKKKKNQDFDRWTNPWVRSEKSQIRNPHSPIVNFPLLAALCPSRVLHPADWRVSELPLSLCPFWSLSLSPDMDRSELLFFLSVSWFFFFFFLLFADCFGPLVWCTVACYIYNTQSFFFF